MPKVTLSTLRANTFKTIFTLIDDNKATGWTVLSAFPEEDANGTLGTSSFPCIVVNPVLPKPTIVTLDTGGVIVEDIIQEIEFYSLAKDGKSKIDEGRQNVQNTILDNTSSLDSNNIILKEDPIDDSNSDSFIVGQQKINTAAMILGLQLK